LAIAAAAALEAQAAARPDGDLAKPHAASAAQGLREAAAAVSTAAPDGTVTGTAASGAAGAAALWRARAEPSAEWFYDTLRAEQNKRWADGRVARGAGHAREQRMGDAMRCYEQVVEKRYEAQREGLRRERVATAAPRAAAFRLFCFPLCVFFVVFP
jgi:hypothetical protein